MNILLKMKQKQQKPLVFISGPYSNGNKLVNVIHAMEAAEKVLRQGGIPFLPHLTHFWDVYKEKDWSDWLVYDSYWLECCSYVVRIPGESTGADAECALATSLGIPVIKEESLDELGFSWKE